MKNSNILQRLLSFSLSKNPRTLRRLTGNAVSLFALQGLTYIISFFTVPFLLRRLGTAGFGSIAFANTVMAQFTLLTDFGFASSATRLVAIRATDRSGLSSLFSAVMAVKMLFLGCAALGVIVLVTCFPRFHNEKYILLVAFFQVVGSVLFPGWLFQGLERMRTITLISIAARLVSTLLIFAVVRGAQDTLLAIVCQSAGVMLQGCAALFIAMKVLKMRLCRPTVSEVWEQIQDSFHPFLGASLGNLVGGSSVLFLGLFKNLSVVGSYAAIERTARAEVLAMLPASQAAYPHVSQKFNESLSAGNRAVVKLFGWLLGGAFLVLAILSLNAKRILALIYGTKLLDQAHLFATFSIWSFFSLLNTLLGLHYLIASGHSKAYGRSVFWSALTAVALFLSLIPHFGSWGALSAVIIGEVVQAAIMIFAIVKINKAAKDLPAPVAEEVA